MNIYEGLADVYVTIRASGLHFVLKIVLHSYFVYASSDSSDETAHIYYGNMY